MSELQRRFAGNPARPIGGKGQVGRLVELALGASAGSLSIPDFPALGIELKTLPVDARGRPRQSTFVCSWTLAEADALEWSSSNVRAKLAHVLWVPVETGVDARIGTPFFWQPSPGEEAILRDDFEDIVGLVAIGHVEHLTAHVGAALQARPKAAHGRIRTWAYGAEGERLRVLPRGFYLRTSFTRQVLNQCSRQAGPSATIRQNRDAAVLKRGRSGLRE